MSQERLDEIWDRVEAGQSYAQIAEAVGRGLSTVRDHVNKHDGIRPQPRRVWSSRRLSAEDREEISRRLIAGDSFRTIGSELGRAPSTICREVNANGGRHKYRATKAERAVRRRANRGRLSKLQTNVALRTVVEAKLAEFWSPEQIANWLPTEFPCDMDMRISHESIYLALYKGTLTTDPKHCLRRKRRYRRRRHRLRQNGPGRIRNPILIAQRPDHVENREEPGHWKET